MALLWAGFIFVVVIMLIIDLGVFHKEPKEISVKDALAWTVVWVTLGLLFSIFVFYAQTQHLCHEPNAGHFLTINLLLQDFWPVACLLHDLR